MFNQFLEGMAVSKREQNKVYRMFICDFVYLIAIDVYLI